MNAAAAAPRALPEKAGRPVHATLRKTENERGEWRLLGAAVDFARRWCGLSLKEFAGAIDRDERQVSRWIAGTERTLVDVIWAVERFRQPLVIGLAQSAGVETETVIRVRRG